MIKPDLNLKFQVLFQIFRFSGPLLDTLVYTLTESFVWNRLAWGRKGHKRYAKILWKIAQTLIQCYIWIPRKCTGGNCPTTPSVYPALLIAIWKAMPNLQNTVKFAKKTFVCMENTNKIFLHIFEEIHKFLCTDGSNCHA